MCSAGSSGYGGDELGALIIDVGQYSLRVGYAHDDTPRIEIPTVTGIVGSNNKNDSHSYGSKLSKYYIDTCNLNVVKHGMGIHTYMKDGLIDDWDLFERNLDYVYRCLQVRSVNHPVLISEATWNTRSKRERLIELMFEKYNVPAFYLVKNAVLTAYANGRSTCLVVDSGSTHTSAIPIQDGVILPHAVVKTPLGGDYITMQCKNFLHRNS